jgi:2-octaprenyl-3-methyl-6-methoxy-1,4-benzoquinol hydroxylase/2-octaprenylphenol hydroxylase
MSAQDHRCEVAIVGAGMVGAALAALLTRAGFSVSLVEAREPPAFNPGQAVGLRVSALSPGSAAILDAAGAWPEIEQVRSCPYRQMRVEDEGHEAVLAFEAPVFGLERLGTIVENTLVQSVLWRLARSSPLLRSWCPDAVKSLHMGEHSARLTLDSGAVIEARLVVAADGADSAVRKQAGIAQQVWDYGQQGIVSVVRTDRPNPGIAWQRFMPGGPLAFLPLADGQSSIVWTRPGAEADGLIMLDDAAFLQVLNAASRGWLGEVLACGPRVAFPLTMRLSDRYVAARTVLLGDAAHVVHPLAGQGVNLGFADAAALVEMLIAQRQGGGDLGDFGLLARYERWRRSESQVMAGGIHALRSLFATPPMAGLRGLGMRLVSRSWLGREAFLRRAAGQGRNAPRLARGEGLAALLRQG